MPGETFTPAPEENKEASVEEIIEQADEAAERQTPENNEESTNAEQHDKGFETHIQEIPQNETYDVSRKLTDEERAEIEDSWKWSHIMGATRRARVLLKNGIISGKKYEDIVDRGERIIDDVRHGIGEGFEKADEEEWEKIFDEIEQYYNRGGEYILDKGYAEAAAYAEKPYRDQMLEMIEESEKDGDEISGEKLLEFARLNKMAEKAGENAMYRRQKRVIAEKIANGEELDSNDREVMRRAEETDERIKKNQREARIASEIEEIVENEKHPLHDYFITEYKKFFEERNGWNGNTTRESYEESKNKLKEIKEAILKGADIDAREEAEIEREEEYMKRLEEEAKREAYRKVKIIEKIDNITGERDPDAPIQPKKKPSIFQRIFGKNED